MSQFTFGLSSFFHCAIQNSVDASIAYAQWTCWTLSLLAQIHNAWAKHSCVRLYNSVLFCWPKFDSTVCITQTTTTVLVIRAWTVLFVVHLVVDSRAIHVHSTWQVPAASSVREILFTCQRIILCRRCTCYHAASCKCWLK